MAPHGQKGKERGKKMSSALTFKHVPRSVTRIADTRAIVRQRERERGIVYSVAECLVRSNVLHRTKRLMWPIECSTSCTVCIDEIEHCRRCVRSWAIKGAHDTCITSVSETIRKPPLVKA